MNRWLLPLTIAAALVWGMQQTAAAAPTPSYQLEILLGTWGPEVRLSRIRKGAAPEPLPDEVLVLAVSPTVRLQAHTDSSGVARFELSEAVAAVGRERLTNVPVRSLRYGTEVTIDLTSYAALYEVERIATKRKDWEERRAAEGRPVMPPARPDASAAPTAAATEAPDAAQDPPSTVLGSIETAPPAKPTRAGAPPATRRGTAAFASTPARATPPPRPERPSGFSPGIGIGYSVAGSSGAQATGGRPDLVSVRFRFPGGVTFEPLLVVASERVAIVDGDTTEEVVTNTMTIESWLRYSLASGRSAEFLVLGGAGFQRLAVRRNADGQDVARSGFRLAWGLAIDYWIHQHWCVSLAAVNPIVSWSEEDQQSGPDTSVTGGGAYFDPTALAMVHLFY